MDTALQMFNVQLPQTELDKAMLDVKKGNVKTFDSLDDMMAYLND